MIAYLVLGFTLLVVAAWLILCATAPPNDPDEL